METAALISDAYLEEQVYLHGKHRKGAVYGSGGRQWASEINRIIIANECHSVIDYGCGKGYLAKHLICGDIQLYDPAIPAFTALPAKADLVICLDVLEHIEPQYLDNVLSHILSLSKLFFISISLKVAGRYLRDGRNAHLILKDARWWETKLKDRGCRLEQTFKRETIAIELVGLWRLTR